MKKDIHSYLEQKKIRALILMPPMFLCITGLGFVFVHIMTHFSFKIPNFVCVGYCISAVVLLTGAGIILWSDHKRFIKRLNNKLKINE